MADLSVANNLFYGSEPRVRFGRIDRPALRSQAAAILAELGVQGIDPAWTARELSLAQRQILEITRGADFQAEPTGARRGDVGSAP